MKNGNEEIDLEKMMTETVAAVKAAADSIRKLALAMRDETESDEWFADSLKVGNVWNDQLLVLNRIQDLKEEIFP